jgi:hypothetical protein
MPSVTSLADHATPDPFDPRSQIDKLAFDPLVAFVHHGVGTGGERTRRVANAIGVHGHIHDLSLHLRGYAGYVSSKVISGNV